MSDNRWIIWQNACEATHHGILEALRKHFRSKAVIPHTETLELIEELYLPLMPEHTVDIAEDIKIVINKHADIIAKQTMEAVNNAVLTADVVIQEAEPPKFKTSSVSFKDKMEEKERRIQQAINEIGVPNKDYPANIANAYEILNGEL